MAQTGRYIIFFVEDISKESVRAFLPAEGEVGSEWAFYRPTTGAAALAIGVLTNHFAIVQKLQTDTNWVASWEDRAQRHKTPRSGWDSWNRKKRKR